MKNKLIKNLPPGTDIKQILATGILLLVQLLIFSIKFLFNYSSAVKVLYVYNHGARVLDPERTIRDFSLLTGRCFVGIWILLAVCIVMAVDNYLSFYKGSKSIYLMKRLPQPTELYRRCLAMPLLIFAAGLVLTGLLIGLYALIYIYATPPQCLPDTICFDFWHMFV